MTFLKTYWLPICLVLALVIGAIWLLTRPVAPPLLAPAAETAVRATVASNQQRVGTDTTRAKQAAATAPANYEAGHAYASVATILHQQSKPHAKTTPIVASDSAATRLQRILTTY